MIKHIDKIYVCHHPPLAERKKILNERFKHFGLDVEWVEDFLPEEIEPKIEQLLEGYEDFKKLKIVHPTGSYENFSKRLSIGELSLYLKHKKCLEDQVNNGYENILILEDDVLLDNNFMDIMNNSMEEFINEDGGKMDMLWVGKYYRAAANAKVKREGKYTHWNKNQLTRCTHAYVSRLETTKLILDNLSPINLPMDFKFNEIMVEHNLKISWCEPGVFPNRKFIAQSGGSSLR